MRSGNDQRPRGRSYPNRPSQPQQGSQQRSQTYNSNGPGDRIRGNPLQLYERYMTLAREAARSDDRVAAENFYQHAEHYFRVSKGGREDDRADGQRADGHQAAASPRIGRSDAEPDAASGEAGESEEFPHPTDGV